MHEHLPVGCQSHDSTVEIRNKLEINYLRRRGGSSDVVTKSRGSQVQGSGPAGADGSGQVNWSSWWVP